MDEEISLGWDDVDEPVVVTMTATGRVVMMPRSLRNLAGEAAEVAADLQAAALEVEQARLKCYRLAAELRDAGVPFSAIGWCMGVGPERARQIVQEVQESN